MENPDLDEEEFEELAAQKYLHKNECSGNFNLYPCLSGSKNDSKN